MPNGVKGSWRFSVATAYAIIGVKIDPQRLYADVKVVACDHDVSKKEAFCPTCGKEVWEIKRQPIPGFTVHDPTFKDSRPECDSTFMGWRILLDQQCSPRFAYVGEMCLASVGGDVHTSPITASRMLYDGLINVRDRLRTSLESVGFWDEGAFGLWLVNWGREH